MYIPLPPVSKVYVTSTRMLQTRLWATKMEGYFHLGIWDPGKCCTRIKKAHLCWLIFVKSEGCEKISDEYAGTPAGPLLSVLMAHFRIGWVSIAWVISRVYEGWEFLWMHFRPQRAIIYLVTHSFKQNIVCHYFWCLLWTTKTWEKWNLMALDNNPHRTISNRLEYCLVLLLTHTAITSGMENFAFCLSASNRNLSKKTWVPLHFVSVVEMALGTYLHFTDGR